MSILIPGMTMPKSCEKCPFCIVNRHDRGDDSLCRLINKEVFTFMRSLPQDCPLVPVPPHGRLIDADALIGLCNIMADKCDGIGTSIWEQFRTTVEWCPTVIPAEEGE